MKDKLEIAENIVIDLVHQINKQGNNENPGKPEQQYADSLTTRIRQIF